MNEHDENCGCGCNDEEEMTVTLTLDDDSEVECAVVAIFPVNGKEYIALYPLDDSSNGDVFLYRYTKSGDEEMELDNIEDDEEFEAVADAYDMLLDDEEYEELLEDEEDVEDEE